MSRFIAYSPLSPVPFDQAAHLRLQLFVVTQILEIIASGYIMMFLGICEFTVGDVSAESIAQKMLII